MQLFIVQWENNTMYPWSDRAYTVYIYVCVCVCYIYRANLKERRIFTVKKPNNNHFY
jgi:hypothetical protein